MCRSVRAFPTHELNNVENVHEMETAGNLHQNEDRAHVKPQLFARCLLMNVNEQAATQ